VPYISADSDVTPERFTSQRREGAANYRTARSSTTIDPLPAHAQPLRFGARAPGLSSLYGWLDEVAIYDYPLTASQALAHYNAGRR
jgi:hypothetical protein